MEPMEVLKQLREGNRRFVGYVRRGAGRPAWARRLRLPREHRPKAVVLGCSDARVPVEVIFDQGPGELFVVRTAGHVLGPAGTASVAFATGPLEVRCIIVLGHTRCAAVATAVQARRGARTPAAGPLRVLLDAIGPAVDGVLEGARGADPEALEGQAVEAHVRATRERLKGDPAAAALQGAGGVLAGAVYEVETGRVVFLDGADSGR